MSNRSRGYRFCRPGVHLIGTETTGGARGAGLRRLGLGVMKRVESGARTETAPRVVLGARQDESPTARLVQGDRYA